MRNRASCKLTDRTRGLLPSSPSGVEVDYDFGGAIENSLASPATSNFWRRGRQTYNSAEDTQALFLAGAPLRTSQFSMRARGTGDSAQSVPSVIRDFVDMFDDDDDDGSYPADFPVELRC